jgi:hypothetical protein
MLPRVFAVIVALAWAVGVPASAGAQMPIMETAVTFNVPVSLTQLPPDIERVGVACLVTSSAMTSASPPIAGASVANWPRDEAWVVLGKVEKTMQVVFPFGAGWLQDPIGKGAEYRCGLIGFSRALQQWQAFSESHTVPAFRLQVNPPNIMGTFVW